MSAQRVLDVARSQLGTVEKPSNSNRQPYGKAYGWDGQPWCQIFVWWVFRESGLEHLVPKSASTPVVSDWFRDRGQWGSTPRLGALAYFNFPDDGLDRISHVGIVEAVGRDGSVICIEGNTSAGTSGSQRDGGGVHRRRREAGIVGFAYPAYPAVPSSSTPEGFLMALSDTEQVELLAAVRDLRHQLFVGEGGPSRPGWVTWQGGTDEQLTAVDYLRRNNVEVQQLHVALAAAHQKLDSILQAVRAAGADPDAVRAAIAEALGGGLQITGTAVPKR